ncbi:MAG: acyl-CoA desaturase [Pseudomonadota bacterium]
MPDDPHGVNYLVADSGGDPVDGRVVVDWRNAMWNGGMLAIIAIGGPLTFSASVFALFITATGIGLLLGHSIGYHRKLIHGSFACPLWLERLLVWFGAYVGMAGPFGIIRTHDLRDWAQRQPDCHPYLAHRASPLRDAWWQIYCRLELRQPPAFDLGRVGEDRFYRWLDATWRWHQLPIALLFYAVGGWGWVIWGVAARVAVANHGHWLVGHLAHRRGPQSWIVDGAGVQAHNVPWAAIPTMGEAWHNNHHAYPGSARIGLYPGQADWGYAVIRGLERLGLAWNVATPVTLPHRKQLVQAADQNGCCCPGVPRQQQSLT